MPRTSRAPREVGNCSTGPTEVTSSGTRRRPARARRGAPRRPARTGRTGRPRRPREREEVELDRRDDAEVAAAAAQRPEEVGLVVGVDAAERAVGGDELDRGDAVRLQGRACGPASPCRRRASSRRRRRRATSRAGRRGRARRPRDDVGPAGAGAHAGAPGAGVDLHAGERVGLQQDGVVEVGERARRCGRCAAARRAGRGRGRTRRPRRRRRRRPGRRSGPGAGRSVRLKAWRAASQPGSRGRDDGAASAVAQGARRDRWVSSHYVVRSMSSWESRAWSRRGARSIADDEAEPAGELAPGTAPLAARPVREPPRRPRARA